MKTQNQIENDIRKLLRAYLALEPSAQRTFRLYLTMRKEEEEASFSRSMAISRGELPPTSTAIPRRRGRPRKVAEEGETT